jgi:hypothetical protein
MGCGVGGVRGACAAEWGTVDNGAPHNRKEQWDTIYGRWGMLHNVGYVTVMPLLQCF